MVERLRLTASIVAQLIGDIGIGEVLPLIAEFNPSVTDFSERERAPHEELEALLLADAECRLLLVEAREFGLWVKRVHLPGTTLHEEHDHVLGTGWKHRCFDC